MAVRIEAEGTVAAGKSVERNAKSGRHVRSSSLDSRWADGSVRSDSGRNSKGQIAARQCSRCARNVKGVGSK